MMAMAEQRRNLAVTLIASVLKRTISVREADGEVNPYVATRKQSEPSFMSTVANKAPAQFSEEIFRIINQIVLANTKPAKCGGYYDDVWRYITFGSEHDSVESLFGSTARTLRSYAKADPEKCQAL